GAAIVYQHEPERLAIEARLVGAAPPGGIHGASGDLRADLAELEAALAEVPAIEGAVVVPGRRASGGGAEPVTAFVAGRVRGGDWRARIRRLAADGGLSLSFAYVDGLPRLPD